jgi:UDP-GlcNAc3NAcA epimerase
MKKHKIINFVGARPQFIKAAAVSRVIRKSYADKIREMIMHTGQHYDDNMSQVFFDQMEIPEPDFYLEAGSSGHAAQTGEIMRKAEEVFINEQPELVIVYGDTNTTLAGALTASKLHIPVAHIEAGLRSFNKLMPEEINRIVSDHTSTLLFTPTTAGYNNLLREGFKPGTELPYSINKPAIFQSGDVMLDNVMHYAEKAEKRSGILDMLGIRGKEFALCTIHRENNTSDPGRLNSILQALDEMSRERKMNFILPLHPRTAKAIPRLISKTTTESISRNPYLKLISPVSYFDMLLLEKNSRIIITDSGGVQKESYFFRKPCLVLRSESEWKELVDLGHAGLVDADPEIIRTAFTAMLDKAPSDYPPLYGNGNAAESILHEIVNFLEGNLQV